MLLRSVSEGSGKALIYLFTHIMHGLPTPDLVPFFHPLCRMINGIPTPSLPWLIQETVKHTPKDEHDPSCTLTTPPPNIYSPDASVNRRAAYAWWFVKSGITEDAVHHLGMILEAFTVPISCLVLVDFLQRALQLQTETDCISVVFLTFPGLSY